MFVTDEMVTDMALRFGVPERVWFEFPVLKDEFDRIRASQKQRRRHDATVYVRKDEQFVVIAKPFYPPGQYRAPSGGLKPEETFDDGIAREMAEEIGCEIALKRFLLISRVRFRLSDHGPTWSGPECSLPLTEPLLNFGEEAADRVIDWISFVFLADYLSGDFQFTDTHEISEVRLAKLEEFNQFSDKMRQSEVGGLHYRAALHDFISKIVE